MFTSCHSLVQLYWILQLKQICSLTVKGLCRAELSWCYFMSKRNKYTNYVAPDIKLLIKDYFLILPRHSKYIQLYVALFVFHSFIFMFMYSWLLTNISVFFLLSMCCCLLLWYRWVPHFQLHDNEGHSALSPSVALSWSHSLSLPLLSFGVRPSTLPPRDPPFWPDTLSLF